MATTKIAGRDVPVDDGPRTIINFWVARGGAEEAGPREFWTAEGLAKGSIACCRPNVDPGEPFRRAEMLPADHAGWETARHATRLRPATAREVVAWLNAHPEDRPATMPHHVRGQNVRIDGQHGDYRIIDLP
jgi:hypothetical protein